MVDLLFLAIQAFILGAWWRLLQARNTNLTNAEVLLCCGVMYFAQIVGVSLLLGWVGLLARGPLLACTLLCSGLVLILASPFGKGGPRGICPNDQSPQIPLAPFFKGGGAVARLNLTLLVLFSASMSWIVVQGALYAFFGWDGLKYHLPMSALMLQTHQLALSPVHNPVIEAYPKDIEIWFHWILSFFRDDRWVDLGQVPFLWMAMLATYCLARRLGSSPASSTAGALLLPFSPVVLTQITTAYNDVALSALLLTAIALLVVARHSTAATLPVALGCAIGLLAGSKFSGVTFALLLLGAFALVTLRSRRRGGAATVVLVGVLVLLLGGETYVRNWRLHGNPFYPYRTSVLNVTLPGPWDSGRVYGVAQTRDIHPIRRLVRSWRAVDVVRHSEIMGGFGITWPFLAVISAVSLVVSIRTRDRARLGIFVLFALLFLATPLSFRVRFVIYLLGLGCVCFSHLLDRAATATRGLLITGALVVTVVSMLQVVRYNIASSVGRRRSADACAQAEPVYFRDAYQWVRRNAAAESTVVILPSGDELFPYCLWNARFSNQVAFAQASTTAELVALATRQPSTILFLPRRAPAYALYAADDRSQWQELFANDHVTLAQAISPQARRQMRPPPAPPPWPELATGEAILDGFRETPPSPVSISANGGG